MFGRSNEFGLDSYTRRRARKRLPGWLLGLLIGLGLGAAAVVLVQQRWLPPRLSMAESTRLTQAFEGADAERTRLRQQVADTTQQLEQAVARSRTLEEAGTAARGQAEQLRTELAWLVDSLPPDPRGGDVQVRAARFAIENGQLAYHLVFTRQRSSTPWQGVVQLVLSDGGQNSRPEPLPLRMDRHGSLRGTLALPARFSPQQASIQVLDRAQGRLLGLRVINIR
ncbi:hypothetical protein [Pseudorhodoferax sp.]|uniref:hypothetical protein n=1 Tax=Pseudorhodoferax sp. TaxID=1993553 RepID=UPI002DD688BD|nr:hypothetical protein [Pseudorhodoferax sp.]